MCIVTINKKASIRYLLITTERSTAWPQLRGRPQRATWGPQTRSLWVTQAGNVENKVSWDKALIDSHHPEQVQDNKYSDATSKAPKTSLKRRRTLIGGSATLAFVTSCVCFPDKIYLHSMFMWASSRTGQKIQLYQHQHPSSESSLQISTQKLCFSSCSYYGWNVFCLTRVICRVLNQFKSFVYTHDLWYHK